MDKEKVLLLFVLRRASEADSSLVYMGYTVYMVYTLLQIE